MKTLLTVLLLLVSICYSFGQEKSPLNKAIVNKATNHDSLLVKYFQQFNPHAKKFKLNDEELNAHLNTFFNYISAQTNSFVRAQDSLARLLNAANTTLEKVKQQMRTDSVQRYAIYQRMDTLIFDDFKSIQPIAENTRNKALAIRYVGELANFNRLAADVLYVDTKDFYNRIDFLNKMKSDWSAVQKTFIDKTIREAKYNLVYLDNISEKIFQIVKEKTVTKADLIKLRKAYQKPVQQKYISEMIQKLDF